MRLAAEVQGIPVMTRSVHDLAGSSREIHRQVSARSMAGHRCTSSTRPPWPRPSPTSSSPRSCAGLRGQLSEVNEVARAIDAEISVVSLEPTSMEGIFNTIATVGAMTEAEDEAIEWSPGSGAARPGRGPGGDAGTPAGRRSGW